MSYALLLGLILVVVVDLRVYLRLRDDMALLRGEIEVLEHGVKWAQDFQGTVNTRTTKTVKALCDAQGFDYYDASPNWVEVKLDTTCTTRVARKAKGTSTTTRRGA